MQSVNLEDDAAKRRSDVVEWLNYLFPDFNLPLESSEEQLKARLSDGCVFLGILRRINMDRSEEVSDFVPEKRLEYIKMFLAAAGEMGLPGFNITDLDQGSISSVMTCLLSLRDHLNATNRTERIRKTLPKSHSQPLRSLRPLEADNFESTDIQQGQHTSGENNAVSLSDRRHQNLPQLKPPQPSVRRPISSEPSTPLSCHAGHQFHEIFQVKQGRYSDLPAARIAEMMKSNSLESAPTQSLLNVVNSILDESIERKNGEVPQRITCLLKKVVHEIERRISTQAEHIRNQISLTKAREEKYKSRIKSLETLARGASEENQILLGQLQLIKIEKNKIEESKKLGDQDLIRLANEKEISSKKISELQLHLETTKSSCERQCQLLEANASLTKEFEGNIKELELLLAESRRKAKQLEEFSELKSQRWNQKQDIFQNTIGSQLQMMQDLKASSESIKNEVINSKFRWSEELNRFGQKLKVLTDAAKSYHTVLAENRKLFNEIQELKGNIRVYCRIRPFLAGENKKSTTIGYIGENGDLLLSNPTRQGKEGHRTFKFNKVFGPAATQEEVFLDIQPLIRSVLDGYNVCIFAYGQTGAGKTYTMTGPSSPAEKDWGVNYRALNDLFQISRNRRETIMYEVGVQMVEIYNEHVRDLLKNHASQKKLGVLNTSQPNGLAVPDASIHPVNSTSDVLKLMQIGLANRAIGATALNERSSRSHSVVTVHVQGSDLKTGATLRASLHLVDLAGSERVDRAQVTGDRLREAQHINKSLASLGDVIFSLSQKSSHVPFRNSKLTQVLQSSLGGQAKTLMFVQINPDVKSYSETISTLKFAERVSGVELGAAQCSKESKDIRDLMQQVASLKSIVASKNQEIECLQLLKERRSRSPYVSARHGSNRLRHSSSSPVLSLPSGSAHHIQRLSGRRGAVYRAASDPGNSSDYSDKQSETSSQNSMDDFRHMNEILSQPKVAGEEHNRSFPGNIEILGFADADLEERLSDISDGCLSVGGEIDASLNGSLELSLFPDRGRIMEAVKKKKPAVPAQIPRPTPQKATRRILPRTKSSENLRIPSTRRSISSQASVSSSKSSKR